MLARFGVPQRHVELHIRRTGGGTGGVPATLVAQVLASLQLALYQVGEHLLGRSWKERGAYSAEVIERCRLELSLAEPGSYHARLVLGEPRARPLLPGLETDDLGGVSLALLMSSLRALHARDHGAFTQQLRDPTVQRRILQYASGMIPRPGEPYEVALTSVGEQEIILSQSLRPVIAAWTAEKPAYEVTVEGQLVELQILPKLHFKVLSVDDQRLVEAEFKEGIEPSLIACMGQMVRVRGTGNVDRRGRVQRLVDVAGLEPITVEYLPVQEARSREVHLRFVRPLQAIKTEEEGLVVLRIPELGLHEFGHTLEEAIEAMNEELVFLWEEYALAAPHELTEDALRLRERLRAIAYTSRG